MAGKATVPLFLKGNPFRTPGWRGERARELMSRGRNPLRFDDSYVRAYVKILLFDRDQAGLGSYLTLPYAHIANSIYTHPDREWRDILEARLLTEETFEEIAARFTAEEGTIDFYEKVFFNVRDRMDSKDWIHKAIIGTPWERNSHIKSGSMTPPQQAMVWRLFAYYGGPEALDAAITGFDKKGLPAPGGDIEKWLDKALEQVITLRSTQAARVMEINKYNILQVLEMAMGRVADKKAAGTGLHANFDEFAKKVTEAAGGFGMLEQSIPGRPEAEVKLLTGPVEARSEERLLAMSGVIPESIENDDRRVDYERIARADMLGVQEE